VQVKEAIFLKGTQGHWHLLIVCVNGERFVH